MRSGEGPEHKLAKETAAGYIHIKYGYEYRYEYPVRIGDRRHTYDAVFWHPTAVLNIHGEPVKVTLYMRNYDNRDLMRPYYKEIKAKLDKAILIVLEIDDYTKHTHKEQLINDAEAETLARDAFAPSVRIIRVKKEDLVEWKRIKQLVTIENSGKLIDDQCKGLHKTFLVR